MRLAYGIGLWFVLAIVVQGIVGLLADPPMGTTATPRPGGPPVDMLGLHNVILVSEKLYSGGVPEGKTGFETLKKLGIKTILSVDGARPDVARAKAFGMRYVHLPIGYDGVTQDQALILSRAVRDLPGPLYLHCHHGKHRSPAAAAAVQFCLDDNCTAAQAIDIMKRAGTDPRYIGLLAAPKNLKRPSAQSLDQLNADFPEVAEVPALAKSMVGIDEHWDHVVLTRKSGWRAPKDHPDLDPPHEALQLREHYRELTRLPEVQKRPDDFKAWLAESEKSAEVLERLLRQQARADTDTLDRAFHRARSLCTQCHSKYRDIPQER